jgi:hypothetical protein
LSFFQGRKSVARLGALAAAGVLLPSTPALARRQAWDVQSLAGSVSLHSVDDKPPSCADGNEDSESGIVSADYTYTVKGLGLGKRGPLAVYFPAFRGPISPGSPLALYLEATATVTETSRVVKRTTDYDGNVTCVQQPDQTCHSETKPRRRHTHFVIQTDRKGVEVLWDVPLYADWHVCTPHAIAYNGPLVPDLISSDNPVNPHYPVAMFHKARQKLRMHFSRSFHVGGMRSTFTWVGTVTSRKTVVPQDCRELHPGSGFVCTMGK